MIGEFFKRDSPVAGLADCPDGIVRQFGVPVKFPFQVRGVSVAVTILRVFQGRRPSDIIGDIVGPTLETS